MVLPKWVPVRVVTVPPPSGPRFGLVAVNRETQERTIKPSAHYLGTIFSAKLGT